MASEPPPRPDAPAPWGSPTPWGAQQPTHATPPPRSGRRSVLVVAIVLLLVGAGALIVFLAQRGTDGFPDRVLGYERLRTDEADRVEGAMEGIEIGEIEIRVAVYGSGGEPTLLAALYDNYPAGVDVETIIQGAASGAEASGGDVDQDSLQVSDSNGYSYACMSGGGPGFLVPGGSNQQGVLCVFHGENVGLIVTTHSQEPTLGLSDARTFVDALEEA
jgi:hypothetical protein